MIIGIVSDSHGKASRLRAALELFAARDVEVVVHCGDIGSLECVDLLGQFDGDAYMVAGNTDRHFGRLSARAEAGGVTFGPESISVELDDGRRLAATHGHDMHLLNELVSGGQFAYVCHGHSHRMRDERIGDVRIINPGALRGPRDQRHPTAAILDTQADTLEHVRVTG